MLQESALFGNRLFLNGATCDGVDVDIAVVLFVDVLGVLEMNNGRHQ